MAWVFRKTGRYFMTLPESDLGSHPGPVPHRTETPRSHKELVPESGAAYAQQAKPRKPPAASFPWRTRTQPHCGTLPTAGA